MKYIYYTEKLVYYETNIVNLFEFSLRRLPGDLEVKSRWANYIYYTEEQFIARLICRVHIEYENLEFISVM